MELNGFAIQLSMLALPGLIWAMLDAANRSRSETTQFLFIIRVFVFGVCAYAVVAMLYRATSHPFQAFDLATDATLIFSDKSDEILWSIPVSFALALCWIAGRTRGLAHAILQRLRITNYAGCEDIWEYSLARANDLQKWVHVRDLKHDLVIDGFVGAYSDRPDLRELLLYDTAMYKSDGEKLYEKPAIYLALNPADVHMEFCEKELKK